MGNDDDDHGDGPRGTTRTPWNDAKIVGFINMADGVPATEERATLPLTPPCVGAWEGALEMSEVNDT